MYALDIIVVKIDRSTGITREQRRTIISMKNGGLTLLLSLADPFSKKESGLRFFMEMMVLRFFHEQCYDEKAEFKCYDDDVESGHMTERRRQEAHERAGEKREEITRCGRQCR